MDHRSGRLDFPWPEPPAGGAVREVAPGLLWARLPLPFRLNHVNVWLLEEPDGWSVIDTGCATDDIRAIWDALIAGPMRGERIVRVIATHGHVDHIGLAGWLVERSGAEFVGTFAEWNWARVSHVHDMPGASSTHLAYLVRHGFSEAVAEAMVVSRRSFIDLATPIPGALTEIRDNDVIRFGNRDWNVIVTRGHAYEHASFFDRQSGILIAGDHLLPRISPVIAVYETMPKANPLGDYLESFPRFDSIPTSALVLPSHGLPYRGIHQRIGQLQEHHRLRLEATSDLLAEPKTGVDLAKMMFPHVEGHDNIGFALAETLAHVNYLHHQGAVKEIPLADGRVAFRATRSSDL